MSKLVSRLNWEQYDDMGYSVELAGLNFDLSYGWKDESWELNIDGSFSIESGKDNYSIERAKAWAEKEILEYFDEVVADILVVTELLNGGNDE